MQPMPGRCFHCGQTLAQEAMAEHVRACCLAGSPADALLLHIRDAYFPQTFWIFALAPADLTLAALDDFLRRLWVDCCGHYSQFAIGETVYARRPNGSLVEQIMDAQAHRQPMTPPLGEVLTPSQTITYAYDDAWPTELHITPLAACRTEDQAEIHLLARNYKPTTACRVCGQPAAWLYTNTWPLQPYCDAHAREHPDWQQPDAFLPYVNSPRVGLCRYRGPQDPALRFEVTPPEEA